MRKIILIDDQPIANYITKKLFELEGFTGEVMDFTNPLDALDTVVNEDDLLILLDLNMPEMNGWQFLETLKNQNKEHQVVIFTSSTSAVDRQKAKSFTNVIKYMTKPMTKTKFSELAEYLQISNV